MKKLLFIHRVHEAGMALAERRQDVEVVLTHDISEPGLIAAMSDVHGVVVRTARISEAVIGAAEKLEVVSRHGVGYDAVDVDALTARGIPLTITPGANSVSVAEHTMAMTLALAKRCGPHDRLTREGRFDLARSSVQGVDVDGKTMLIIGFGRIGSRVAPRALAFGMRVYACDPYIDQGLIEAAGCTPVADFRAVLPEADVVTVHTPLTAETRGMLGEQALAELKPSAIVINTARGGIVDESALADALERNAIAGAGVDVFECEPTPPAADHPLFRFDNAIVSPHCAGVSLEASIRMAQMATQHVLDAFDGTLDPQVVVNRDVLGAKPARA